MSEKDLFAACGLGYPSTEELYRFTERLGMICGAADPTKAQLEWAAKDVIQFRNQEYLEHFPKA